LDGDVRTLDPEVEQVLIRYDPFRELDRFSEQLFAGSGTRSWMPMDAVRKADGVELRFDLPGVAPDSVDVSVERNVLTVKAERTWYLAEGEEALAKERAHGAFTRQVFLGEALDTEHLEARYDHGVLTVTIPTAEQAKARKVEIQTGEPLAVESA
jgi:HSP20 family protein